MKRAWGVVLMTVVACGGDGAGPSDDDGAQGELRDARTPEQDRDAGPRLDARAPLDAAPLDAAAPRAPDATSTACALGTPNLDVVSVQVRKRGGGSPVKGDALEIEVELRNTGGGARVHVTPELDSLRFSDYSGVPLASESALACPGTTRVVVQGGPFLAKGHKQYALGSGRYTVSAVRLDDARDTVLEGASFTIATSGALLVPVVYDQRYLDGIEGKPFRTPEAYLEASFTRPNQIFTPSGSDPDGAGTYQDFPGGFDQMMKVTHHFKSFPAFPGEPTTDEGWCEDAAAYGSEVLGLARPWLMPSGSTRPERHGFDYLIALHPDMGGGVACGWLDVQVSGFINRDLDRQAVIAVHESGHIFGAPHCDDVGNGAGGTLQGYVMCSGEKHPSYPGSFVWHATSLARMKSHWD
jgi:hypothetical protein